MLLNELMQIIEKGGPRSGNWSHDGRPGKKGGSAPGGGFGRLGKVTSDHTRADIKKMSQDRKTGSWTLDQKVEYAKSQTNMSEDSIREYMSLNDNKIAWEMDSAQFVKRQGWVPGIKGVKLDPDPDEEKLEAKRDQSYDKLREKGLGHLADNPQYAVGLNKTQKRLYDRYKKDQAAVSRWINENQERRQRMLHEKVIKTAVDKNYPVPQKVKEEYNL